MGCKANFMSILKKVYRDFLPQKLILWLDVKRGLRAPFLHEVDKRKAIFVHIPKAAGSSISKDIFFGQQVGHFYASDYKFLDHHKYNDYFKFTFVRNPYTRFVSAYNYLSAGGGNGFDKSFYLEHQASFASINQFVDDFFAKKEIRNWIHFVPQSHFLTVNGKVEMDFVGRFEKINDDIVVLKNMLSIPVSGDFKKVNRSVDRNEVLTNENKEKLYEYYKEDFELFGYER